MLWKTELFNSWSSVLPEKLKSPKLLKKFPAFYKPEGSTPCTQEPVTCPILSQINPVYAPTQPFEDSL
jgi:hypothetical protein